jgi:riboflavin kinase/FMN adenylyltransferase
LKPSAVTIGNFDGLHAGHRRIMQRVVEVGRANGWTPTVLTFDPHPTKVVAPSRAPKLMTTTVQRRELMNAAGIERVVVLPFTRELSKLTPAEFAGQILCRELNARAVLVGANFRFGAGQAGDTETLARLGEALGFTTEVVPAATRHGRIVSSSGIRKLIEQGNVSLAGRLLERYYALEGEVAAGRGVGSRQTVPTLNLDTRAELLPAVGVYITRVTDLEDPARAWESVTNVGFRPTFGASDRLSIETHLLSSIDGPAPPRIRVEFLRRVRQERTFENPDALKAQILRDVSRARSYFRRLRRWRRI